MHEVVPSAVSAAVSAAIATRITTSQKLFFFIVLSPIIQVSHLLNSFVVMKLSSYRSLRLGVRFAPLPLGGSGWAHPF